MTTPDASASSLSSDVLVIGGGAVGLSLAWELARRGARVTVVDRREMGQEASWAAAGMIPVGPAADRWPDAEPLEALAGLSQRLHPAWHEMLLEQTGIDNGYRRTGAVHLAPTPSAAAALRTAVRRADELGMAAQEIAVESIDDWEPALGATRRPVAAAAYFADEAQVRSPWHLRALEQACRQAGVELRPHCAVRRLVRRGDRVAGIETADGLLVAATYCLTAGCWSGPLLESWGGFAPVRPVRGQMALLRAAPDLLGRHVCIESKYLVPRTDGRVLVGSTEEDVGFQRHTTDAAIAQLVAFAVETAPALAAAELERSWAGLRPQAIDGRLALGPVAQGGNLWIATGHYRGGIQLAPATALCVAEVLAGGVAPVDLTAFSPRRWPTACA